MAKIKNTQVFNDNVTAASLNVVPDVGYGLIVSNGINEWLAPSDVDLSADGTLFLRGSDISLDSNVGQTSINADSIVFSASNDSAWSMGGSDLNFINGTATVNNNFVFTFNAVPKSTVDPSTGNDLVRKSYADSTYLELTTVTVQTTNATPTALATIAIATNSAVTIKAYISAAKSDYTDITGGEIVAVVGRAGGSPSLIETTFPVEMPTSTATFDVVISGNNALIQVTGIAATTYNWKAKYFTVIQS